MSEQVEAAGEAVADSSEAQVSSIPRVSQSLYFPIGSGGASSLTELMKAEEVPKNATSSSQGVATGRKGHPFNFEMAGRFQSVNVHHGRSIHTKVAATVGLGFESLGRLGLEAGKWLGQFGHEGIGRRGVLYIDRLGLGDRPECVHEPGPDRLRVRHLDDLSPFGEKGDFGHFADQL